MMKPSNHTSNPRYDYVFGFGSIINTATHAPWLDDATDQHVGGDHKTSCSPLQGQRANIQADFGYERGWFFRSKTGFTALGIRQSDVAKTGISGVLFRIKHELLEGFDRREVGYDRKEIDVNKIELVDGNEADVCHDQHVVLDIQPDERIWVYVPQESSCADPDEDHPILQSYVDTVMQGCLEWGGNQMVEDFVKTTSNWSPFFLNDAPLSRRPWLYRKDYHRIDDILSQNSDITHFVNRQHPEKFASACLMDKLRATMEKEPNDLPDVFFSTTNTSREVHDSLVVEIEKLQTPEECRKFYDRPVFNNCLQNLGNAQQRFRDSYEGNQDDWAKMWALAKSSNSSHTREQAECYDRDRKVCLELLYQVCNLCFRKPPTEDSVPSLNTRRIWPCGMDGQYGLVKVFELRRITDIVMLCLPMDRANALYHMRNRSTQELYRCWLGHHHVEEIGPKFQNKRFLWLLSTEKLAFDTQERNLMKMWLQPARESSDDSTLIVNGH